MSASYERGKADPAAPWKWRFDYGRLRIETNDGAGVCYADTERDADYLCKTAREAQVMRAALDTLYHVVGLTAIKYPGQLAALNEAVDVARAAFQEFPK